MVGCFFLFYIVNFAVGYTLDDVDVPLPPSYLEQQSQWQNQPIQNVYGADNYPDAYYQAGNPDPNLNYDQQDYEEQYPRMAAAMEEPAEDVPPPPQYDQPQQPVPLSNPATSQDAAEPSRVVPQYIPPKRKSSDKDEDPYLTPQWKSDEGIGDGRNPKIVAALEAITADLIDRGKELTAERRWTKQVESMLELYREKVANVHTHSEQIRKEMKTLLKKKRQIENVEVQDELNSKLRMAQSDLEALDGAMSHVQNKADEFAEKKKKLESQINKITSHLKNLQGVKETPVSEDEDIDEETPVEAQKLTTEKNAAATKSEDEEAEDEEPKKAEALAKTVISEKDDDEDIPETPKQSDAANTTVSEPKFRTKKSHQKKNLSITKQLRGGEPLTPKKNEMDEE